MAPFSIRLSVRLTRQTSDVLKTLGIEVNWEKAMYKYLFQHPDESMTIDDLTTLIEQLIVNLSNDQEIQVQLRRISFASKVLKFEDLVTDHLKSGDTVVADGMALSTRQMRPQLTEAMLDQVRATLRFGLNDRVLCYCGPRHLAGHVVGTAVVSEGDLLPYLVKTDPAPGLESRTISVPSDNDGCCTQEICFHPKDLEQVKAAAAIIPNPSKVKLRFAVGDKIVCRIRNSPKDGLEQWIPGVVSVIWPKLPGDRAWELGDMSGNYPEVVPYRIEFGGGGWLYCHRDDHTLIRREGMEPVTRVKGTSKRMELRKNKDGTQERIDHVTERKKRLMTTDSSDSD